ncbi:hypothetical protein AVEN_125593-1 [Araneus ventricosus]|uniref:Uncharacterized protein n=1 Tax=Araneus ventricosus TaxID=182803 RepID=A0A4Y2N0B0_ARAVE|nr:hypothetical protein AVEN_125593-1 [Araneus ventricosus]
MSAASLSEPESASERYKCTLECPTPIEAEVHFSLPIGKGMIHFVLISGVVLVGINFLFFICSLFLIKDPDVKERRKECTSSKLNERTV